MRQTSRTLHEPSNSKRTQNTSGPCNSQKQKRSFKLSNLTGIVLAILLSLWSKIRHSNLWNSFQWHHNTTFLQAKVESKACQMYARHKDDPVTTSAKRGHIPQRKHRYGYFCGAQNLILIFLLSTFSWIISALAKRLREALDRLEESEVKGHVLERTAKNLSIQVTDIAVYYNLGPVVTEKLACLGEQSQFSLDLFMGREQSFHFLDNTLCRSKS